MRLFGIIEREWVDIVCLYKKKKGKRLGDLTLRRR